MSNEIPNPGSKEAIALGCKCPVIDNYHGDGVPSGNGNPSTFWYSFDCPVHTSKTLYED